MSSPKLQQCFVYRVGNTSAEKKMLSDFSDYYASKQLAKASALEVMANSDLYNVFYLYEVHITMDNLSEVV